MELDYQTALLLQYKFEQNHRSKKEDTASDHQLALELQEQFNSEEQTERPTNNLVYKAPTTTNPSKCLVDPSWEVIDPTPDVHMLFISFDQQFFWKTLGSVTVAWSQRMTTCAGICSYQGFGGMCSITLSEPLLKLRPRKDLVETLLHEMIHAYLFVTHNNRDRDGHGPEFHKHMYRINAEAGTNITVYHDFHDEVRQYQQHWWRCDGPCQTRKPYFGMVRRAMNRPPGPNDRWWNEHMANCGGNFVKVKSPEVPSKNSKAKVTSGKSSSKKANDPNNDIRKYINPTSSVSKTVDKPQKGTKTSQYPRQNSQPNDVQTISNSSRGTAQVSNVIPSKSSNIFGFTGLAGASKSTAVKGAVKNAGSSTFVVNKKGPNSHTSTTNPVKTSTVQPFAGVGRSLSTSSITNQQYSTVRECWLKKFDTNKTAVKRPNPSESPRTSSKQVKVESQPDKVECPVCNQHFTSEMLDHHLDQCLEAAQKSGTKECIICSQQIVTLNYESHVTDCTEKHFGVSKAKTCPACNAKVQPADYNLHLQDCILKICDNAEKLLDSQKEQKTSCLACGQDILKSELDLHLEDCMSMSNVFDTSNVPTDEAENLDKTYNCPFCLQLVSEGSMQEHIDGCLKSCEGDVIIDLLLNSDSDEEL